MDLPVAVGLFAGLAASLYALGDPSREVYFDSIACLVFFLLTGRWLQMRGQRRAGEAVAELVRMAPSVATRIDSDGNTTRVSVDEIKIGDSVLVQPGESVPIDGIVTAGSSLVDRSLLTGESRPVEVAAGDQVEAGTDNTQSALTIRVTAASDETRLEGIKNSVAEAAQSRTPVVQLANRIGAWFVVVVLGLALVTGTLWWSIDPSQSVRNVVALLIVACPCALALATPLAIAVSIGRLARRSVLVRSGDCLERISKPGTIFFDKTGTITEGRMRVTSWHGTPEVLQDVTSIESGVNHPIAHAIVDFTSQQPSRSLRKETATNIQHQVGRGVSGSIQGHQYKIGSMRLLEAAGLTIQPEQRKEIDSVLETGSSVVVVIRDQNCEAVLGVADPVRSDASDVIHDLRSRGWQVELLSGDHQPTVSRVAASLGISAAHARGGLMPEDKLSAIHQASSRGPVLMVGDGVNDASALAAADVGIAIRGGARASLAAAPVVIGHGKLSGVADLVAAAGSTRNTIGRNFAISIGYNVIAVALAMTGWITPLIAAALMPTSSLTVLGLTVASPQATGSVAPNQTAQ